MNARETGLFWRAAGSLALAGMVFVLVYGGCNQFTSTRADVGSCYFEWERSLPFVPWMIVPYWTLDLFFCGAFFLCASRAELRLLTTRLVAVVLACAIFFLLFPMRFGWERPEPSGWTAPLFHVLYANDQPFNLAPSLHISLRSLAWVSYGAHLRGWLRTVVKVWFILIGISTLLVWQHHFIDVVGGFLMGWFIKVLIPASPWRPEPLTPAHRRMALRVGGLAVAFATVALMGGGWLWFGRRSRAPLLRSLILDATPGCWARKTEPFRPRPNGVCSHGCWPPKPCSIVICKARPHVK